MWCDRKQRAASLGWPSTEKRSCLSSGGRRETNGRGQISNISFKSSCFRLKLTVRGYSLLRVDNLRSIRHVTLTLSLFKYNLLGVMLLFWRRWTIIMLSPLWHASVPLPPSNGNGLPPRAPDWPFPPTRLLPCPLRSLPAAVHGRSLPPLHSNIESRKSRGSPRSLQNSILEINISHFYSSRASQDSPLTAVGEHLARSRPPRAPAAPCRRGQPCG